MERAKPVCVRALRRRPSDLGCAEMDSLEEKTLHVETVYEGRVVTLKRHRVRLPDGNESWREVVEHPGAVAVLPVLPDGRIWLIRQYRKPAEEVLVEVPAGKLEPGELPEAAVRRELQEETGLAAERLQFLFSFYTSPGFANEIIHLYIAWIGKDGARRPPALDVDEFVQPLALTLEEGLRWVADGRIRDAKTILALQALHMMGKK